MLHVWIKYDPTVGLNFLIKCLKWEVQKWDSSPKNDNFAIIYSPLYCSNTLFFSGT